MWETKRINYLLYYSDPTYPFYHRAVAQIQNITHENTNNTRQFINLKNNTITVINTTTNEIIRTIPYTENTGNMTAENTVKMTINLNLREISISR